MTNTLATSHFPAAPSTLKSASDDGAAVNIRPIVPSLNLHLAEGLREPRDSFVSSERVIEHLSGRRSNREASARAAALTRPSSAGSLIACASLPPRPESARDATATPDGEARTAVAALPASVVQALSLWETSLAPSPVPAIVPWSTDHGLRGDDLAKVLESRHTDTLHLLRDRFGLSNVPPEKQFVVSLANTVDHARRLANYLQVPNCVALKSAPGKGGKTAKFAGAKTYSQTEHKKMMKTWENYCDDHDLDEAAIVFIGHVRPLQTKIHTGDGGQPSYTAAELLVANRGPYEFAEHFLPENMFTPKYITFFVCGSESYARAVDENMARAGHRAKRVVAVKDDFRVECFPPNAHGLDREIKFFYGKKDDTVREELSSTAHCSSVHQPVLDLMVTVRDEAEQE